MLLGLVVEVPGDLAEGEDRKRDDRHQCGDNEQHQDATRNFAPEECNIDFHR